MTRRLNRAYLLPIVLMVVGVLLLSACGSDGYSDEPEPEPTVHGSTGDNEVMPIVVDVNGRKITCIIVDGFRNSAISCDWAKPEPVE